MPSSTAAVTEADGQQQQQLLLSPQSQYLPRTISRSYEILSVPTDAWMQLFQDPTDGGSRVLLLGITQLDLKVGTWLWCQLEPDELNVIHSNNNKKHQFHWSLLLGGHASHGSSSSSSTATTAVQHENQEALWGLYGRRILEQISTSSSSSGSSPTKLLLGISLQPSKSSTNTRASTPEMMHAIVDAMVQLYTDLLSSSTHLKEEEGTL